MRPDFRVKGFSLMETLIVLVISGLITGAVYFVFTAATRYYAQLQATGAEVQNINGLHTILSNDVNKSESIRLINEGLSMEDDRGKRIALYSFYDDRVIRHQLDHSDTFRCKDLFVDVSFRRQPVKDRGLLDMIEVDFVVRGEKVSLKIFKEYSVSSLLNFEPDSIK